jgi:hypothetical protein
MSRQRQPGATPTAPRFRSEIGSNMAAIPSSLARSTSSALSKK